MNVDTRLMLWREFRRITQTELGRRAGVTGQAICQFETGQSEPRLSTLAAIVDGLGISMSRFWGRLPQVKSRA